MNDTAALKRSSEIVLANESPFVLAGSQVRPAALEVEHDGAASSLEPRVMQVLVALHRGAGHPVSRDTLIAQCWGGRVVTEGALNRCIAQLRKALSPNTYIRVETIPKVGYRLRAEDPPAQTRGEEKEVNNNPDATSRAAPAAAALAAERDKTDAPPTTLVETATPGAAQLGGVRSRASSSLRPRIFVAVAVALVIAIGSLVWWFLRPQPVTWRATSYRPITTDLGNEVFPALSPDGDEIVYAARPTPFAPSELYLRNVEQGTPLQLTDNTDDDYGAAWSPHANRIAFVRSTPDGPCSIMLTPIPRGPQRVVTQCQTAVHTRLSWLNDFTLVFDDAPGANELHRIRTVEISSGIVRDLTSPPKQSLGDAEPVVSPNGRYVVFRRTLVPGADDLFVLDMTTRKERALTTDGWKASGYAWSGDSRHIFFSSNRGGEFGLWSVDLEVDGPPRQASLGLGTISFTRISSDRRNRLAVEMTRGSTNLARVKPDGTIEPVTTGSGSEWEATAAQDGTIAYISNRSGSYQFWLMRPGSDAMRITNLLASYLTAPSWSRDGKTIAFVAVTGRRAEIYTIGRDEAQVRQITHDEVGKRYPVYSPSGDSLFYVAQDKGSWRLMQISLKQGAKPEPVPGGEGWRALRADASGNLYGQRDNQIIALNPSSPHTDVVLTEADTWAVGARGIYVRRGRTPAQPSAIWLHPWNGSPQKLAETPFATSGISIDRDNSVLFAQSPEYAVDLGLLELRTP